MFAENGDYEILTPSGWRDFHGITKNTNKLLFRLTIDNDIFVDATAAHYFFQDNKKIRVADLMIGDAIDTIDGKHTIIDIKKLSNRSVYDIIESSDKNHQFIVNNYFITKNCDEMAFIKRQTVAREMWTSCSLTLAATGGKAIITSTPNNSDDLFAETWNAANKTEDELGNTLPDGVGINGFKAFRAYWYEHPERDDAWAAMWREKIGNERFEREILCRFVTFEETLISPIKLSELTGVDPIEHMGQIRWYTTPEKNRTYLVALDPSFGTGGDPAAIQILDAISKIQCGEWCHNKTPIEGQVKILTEITTYLTEIAGINNVFYSVENNSVGEATLVTIRDIGEENIPGIFLSEPMKLGQAAKFRKGFCTTGSSKRTACSKLKQLIESDKLTVKSKKLLSELKTFISMGNSYEAKIGETDDLVTAMLTIVRMLDSIKNYIPGLDDDLREIEMPLPFFVDLY